MVSFCVLSQIILNKKKMRTIAFILFLFIYQTSFGQLISKREAIKIAKSDTLNPVNKVKSTFLIEDSLTQTFFWVIMEQINIKKVTRKKGGVAIYANNLTINAENGGVVKRERILIRKMQIDYKTRF